MKLNICIVFTGRILVGLRWWNHVDSEGKSHWIYEARKVYIFTRLFLSKKKYINILLFNDFRKVMYGKYMPQSRVYFGLD